MAQKQQKNPASGFLVMAAFNLVGAIAFIIFYFLYEGAGGDQSFYLLLAAGIGLLAAVASLVLYQMFRKKFEGLGRG